MNTQPSISLACLFFYVCPVRIVIRAEGEVIKEAWDRCMGYALGLGMLMKFPWEGMRFGDDLFWVGVFGALLLTVLLFGVLLVGWLVGWLVGRLVEVGSLVGW